MPDIQEIEDLLDSPVDYKKLKKNMDETEEDEPLHTGPKVGRNEPCHCGSGRKYKNCCLWK